jgi:hypothetical protein
MSLAAKYWKPALFVITFGLLMFHAFYYVLYDKKLWSGFFVFLPVIVLHLFAPAYVKKYGVYFGFVVIVGISPLMGYDFYQNGGLETWEIAVLAGLCVIDYVIVAYLIRKLRAHFRSKKNEIIRTGQPSHKVLKYKRKR